MSAWLDAELEHVWLLAERALRQLQRAGLRPESSSARVAEVEAVLIARGQGSERYDATGARVRAAGTVARELRAMAPLGRLAARLELRPLEADALVFALAPHVDPVLAGLFAAVRGDGPGRGVDPALVAQILGLGRAHRVALLDALDERRPLLAWELVRARPADAPEAWDSLQHRALLPTRDALALLGACDDVSPSIAHRARLVRTAPPLASLALGETERARWDALCAEAARGAGPWLAFRGPAGAGRATLASQLAAAAGQPLVVLSVRAESDLALVRAARRDALLFGAALHVDVVDDAVLPKLVDALAGCAGRVSFGIAGDAMVRAPVREVVLGPCGASAGAQLWDRALGADVRSPDVDVAALATAVRLVPGEILGVARDATVDARARGASVTHAELRGAVERRLRNELSSLAVPIEPTCAWDDLVLPAADLDRVWEVIHRHRLADVVMEEWGFGRRLGYGRGTIALFSGPPGTGKTMLAGLIARELGLALYQVDLSQVMSRWVGETEKQLARVFELAERAQAVLLFDEADSLFARRSDVTSANDRYANLAVNYLLQRLEQHRGVAVMTTNKDAMLDDALRRRLAVHLQLGVPAAPERARLWRSMFGPATPLAPDVSFEALASAHAVCGGTIKNAAVRAAFLAAGARSPVTMAVLRRALSLELGERNSPTPALGTFSRRAIGSTARM